MAKLVEPPDRFKAKGKHYYTMWNTLFELDLKYVPIKPLGRGSYGVVCSSINRETNERVAIKKISNTFDHPTCALRTLRELTLLRKILHRNVIALKDVMMPTHRSSFKDVYLVYELMDTDLDRIINSSIPLSTDHCQYFLFQLLEGLKHIHSGNVLHRDLKPANLLVNANFELKICDFGLARTKQENDECMTKYVVTCWYRAPEILLGCDNYGTSIDMWSVGCILAEILGRTPIFPGTDSLNQLNLIIDLLGSQQEEDLEFIKSPNVKEYIKSLPFTRGVDFSRCYPSADPLAVDLLQKMLVFNPTKRISATEALEHPFMKEFCDPKDFPLGPPAIDLDVDEKVGVDTIREMILKEILYYHPEASFL